MAFLCLVWMLEKEIAGLGLDQAANDGISMNYHCSADFETKEEEKGWHWKLCHCKPGDNWWMWWMLCWPVTAAIRDTLLQKERENVGILLKHGGGASQIPIHLKTCQVIFCMPKSKTCFAIGGGDILKFVWFGFLAAHSGGKIKENRIKWDLLPRWGGSGQVLPQKKTTK